MLVEPDWKVHSVAASVSVMPQGKEMKAGQMLPALCWSQRGGCSPLLLLDGQKVLLLDGAKLEKLLQSSLIKQSTSVLL